jgi:hypothetical protein
MKIKLFGMMMAMMCLAMVGGVSAIEPGKPGIHPMPKLPETYMVNDITITVTNPSVGFHSEPVYNKNYVKLLGYSIKPSAGDFVVETYYFHGKVGERIIMNQYEPGINVPIATSVYIIPTTLDPGWYI